MRWLKIFYYYITIDNNRKSDFSEDEEFEDGLEVVDDDDDDEDENDEFEHLHHQVDNNLSSTLRYSSKTMRLNSECSDPTLLKNCRSGQKWQCINENGRWRKHKCKYKVK